MLWLDRKYAGLVKSSLQLPKDVGSSINFRCPYCGDSEKNKYKRRGYLIQGKDNFYYYCHNCNAHRSMSDFLKEQSPALHREYVLEILAERKKDEPAAPVPKPEAPKTAPAAHAVACSPSVLTLPVDHAAPAYLRKRKIPASRWGSIFYTESWADDVNATLPRKMHWRHNGRPALVFVARKDGVVQGAQARFLDGDENSRYVTANFFPEEPLIWGIDDIDRSKRVYVMEGIFDAISIGNAVACLGTHVSQEALDAIPRPVLVPDNEPRNETVMRNLSKHIDAGREVVVWSPGCRWKDVNKMLEEGLDVESILAERTMSGIPARLAFSLYTRC